MMTRQSIVILHGWGLSGKTFQPLAAEFVRRGYHVVTPDLPGFGESPVPASPLRLFDYAMFVHRIIREKHLDRPVLIGHSFGGRVALRYQMDYPNSVTALILTGTPGFTPIPKRKLALFIILAKVGKLFFSLPIVSLAADRVRRWYYYVVGARDFYRAEGVMRDTFKHIVKEDLVAAMQRVDVPCLLVWGSDDMIIPVSIARRMERVIRNAMLLVVPSADHGIPFKNPKLFASHAHEFLKKVAAGG